MTPKLPPICPSCPSYKVCKIPCHQINMLADGNKPLREVLREVHFDRHRIQDYKVALIDRQENIRLKKVHTQEEVNKLNAPVQIKIIAWAFTQGSKVKEIAETLRISRPRIYQIIREYNLTIQKKDPFN